MGKAYYLCPPLQAKGIVAEWLGSALQKLLQRFESARYLSKEIPSDLPAGFLVGATFYNTKCNSIIGSCV